MSKFTPTTFKRAAVAVEPATVEETVEIDTESTLPESFEIQKGETYILLGVPHIAIGWYVAPGGSIHYVFEPEKGGSRLDVIESRCKELLAKK